MSFCRIFVRVFSTSAESDSTPTMRSISGHLYKDRSLKQLVQKFKKSSEFKLFRTKISVYKHTVHRLASAKCFNWIEEILEHQKKYKDMSKEGFSARLINLYGRSGMFEHAQKVFDEMHERKCSRTVLSLNALLGAGLNSKKFDLVGELFKELPKKLSIEPDLISYNMVIKAFCEMGSFDLAISMLDEMEKKGMEPDLITFKTLLHGLYGKCQFSDGEKIWDRMKKKNVVLGDRSYNAKLLGLALEKKTKEAVELVEEMKSKGVKPNLFSFNAVIKGFVNEGNLEEAKLWYNKIGQSSLAPDRMIFNMLIPFFCEKGEVDLAFNLCKEILKRKFVVDVSLLQLVVDGLVKESKMEEANKLVELGKFNKYARYTPLFSNTMKV
ncbi:hypothetical protein FH972_000287 [Carpinus fangiana]|uniref:Pentacotripeptide-repeat region of PRORP domain-containing protein n=1 Tax=Carpinus fangiana TaxID=176857 RepID=A0A5N6QBE7_9ROSI|nr:hypothetical protein FH972_000287 [Carpinus fangiana]